MLPPKPRPRLGKLRVSRDRTFIVRNSIRCPAPAGAESAARRAIPRLVFSRGNNSRVCRGAVAIFAISSPLDKAYARSEGGSSGRQERKVALRKCPPHKRKKRACMGHR